MFWYLCTAYADMLIHNIDDGVAYFKTHFNRYEPTLVRRLVGHADGVWDVTCKSWHGTKERM